VGLDVVERVLKCSLSEEIEKRSRAWRAVA